MAKRLITSALPYVNNIPHLGNLIQVLSADVFARFCRLRGYDTLYICGTDEHGTATETKAREEGISPQELCRRYYDIHDEIYRWFTISFDRFGRTSTAKQTEITQSIFLKLYENGYIREREIEQLYSEESQMFLADRYVRGTCPHCGYEDARGDQCEHCGTLLDPAELIEPRSTVDSSRPVMRKSNHLYIDLPAILPKLQAWIDEASKRGKWSNNAIQMTQSWIRDGLKERGITRDLKWGIPVPLDGYRDKVFYVWFDAPIGYISITANHTDDWETWWKNPENVELFQFIGKDNIPFHTVIFPSSLLGTGENWTLLHTMSSTEYLNYETGQFSKSRGIGVFGNDAQNTGIPADVWRFYIFYNRPETSDFMFTWDDFQERTNSELIGNLGNLVNRTLTFVHKYFDGVVPTEDQAAELPEEEAGSWRRFWSEVGRVEQEITDHLERAELRDAFRDVFALSSRGNRAFQQGEPWKTRKENPPSAAALLRNLVFLVRDLAILCYPYIPETSERIAGFLGVPELSWADLGTLQGVSQIEKPEILFNQLEGDHIQQLRERFSGSQAERQAREADQSAAAQGPNASAEAGGPDGGATTAGAAEQGRTAAPGGAAGQFLKQVDLRAARITHVEKHPKADKLYVETLDDGTGEERTIVSGLVPYYKPEELEGRTIIVVANLKAAKLRGVESRGMLLAAEPEEGHEDQGIEVLFLDGVEPGTRIALEEGTPAENPGEISIDDFFEIPFTIQGGVVTVEGTPLSCNGSRITTSKIKRGTVG